MGGYLLNYNRWRSLHESVIHNELYGDAINEQLVSNLVSASGGQKSIESLVGKMGDIATSMGGAYATFINEWKQNTKFSWSGNSPAIKTFLQGKNATGVETELTTFLTYNKNDKYIKPSFTTTVNSVVINTAKGVRVPTSDGGKIIWEAAPAICKSVSAINHANMFNGLTSITKFAYSAGSTKDELDIYANKDTIKKIIGKAYWPDRANFTNGNNDNLIVLMWDGSSLSNTAGLSPKTSSLGGGIKPEDFAASADRLMAENLTEKYVFYTSTDFVKGGGAPYKEFTTTTVSVPTEGGEEAVQVADEKTSLPGINALFAQGKAVPVAGKEAAITEALNQILGQYSKVTSIKVQGSASWEWTAGARDDAQNLALSKQRAQWFITKIGKPEGVTVSFADTPAVVQPNNDANTATQWRVVNFFITGDKVEKRKLPTKWIDVTETGDVTLNYDKITIKEYTVTASWKSPGLVTSIGWGKGEGKAEEKAAAKAEKKANRAVKENRIKFKELKPEQEIVIFDKSTPPNEVGGTDTKKVFVVGPGTEKGTTKVKLMDYTDPANPKLIKEADIPEERYVTHIEKQAAPGEDNI
jgi:hypothetical protein